MEDNTPKVPVAQEIQPEAKDVPQTSQQTSVGQPPTDSQTPSGSIPPEKLKRGPKKKKIVLFLILVPVLAIVAYVASIVISYLNCTKITPKVCETNTCSFSLTGFEFMSETKENCCGNTKCEVGETYPECADCPNCDDGRECTKENYDYDQKACVYEQLFAPCNVRSISLSPATSEDDYQVKVELSSTIFDYSKAKEKGEDIRFVDGSDTPLSFWIEEWNKEGESTVWVKVPSSGTDKIYMSYGNTDASSASDALSVFEYYEGFDYQSEGELKKVWSKHGSPTIELSDGIVTISTSGTTEEHGGQLISKNFGVDVLLGNIFEMSVRRFSEGSYGNHMANIGYDSPAGGPVGDNNAWVVLRYNPAPDGGTVVFGGNHGGFSSPPKDSFNTFQVYHQSDTSYAYEPPGTKVAQYAWPVSLPQGGYVLLGGQTYKSGNGKASYDWIRVRKHSSKEPSVTVGDEEVASKDSLVKELN